MSDSKKRGMIVSIQDEREDFVPTFYKTMYLHNTPVASDLTRELPYWEPQSPVLLDLPTGSGKTTFVYDVVIPAAVAQGRNVLLLSNRIALSCQQKRGIMERLDDPKRTWLTDEGVRHTDDFGPVRVITYHRLPSLLKDTTAAAWLANLAYVVADEAHFFTSDAVFNGKVDYLLQLLCQRFCHATRIYLTATSWDVLKPLAEAELKYYRPPLRVKPEFGKVRYFYRYTMPRDFRQYHLRFFRDFDELLPEIKGKPEARWLLFTNSKARGKDFCEKLGNRALYLDADSKGTAAWNHVLSGKSFPQQVLVTTSALDNGIDIIDQSVHHIAIVTDNRISLMQMMGRRRLLDKDESVTLWVCELPRKTISDRTKQYNDWLGWYQKVDQCCYPEHYLKMAQAIWRDEDPALRKLFWLAGDKLFPNRLARHVISRRQFFFQRILDGQTSFQSEVRSWLGKDLAVEDTPLAQLKNFCQEKNEEHLSVEEQEALRQLVLAAYRDAGLSGQRSDRANTEGYRALSNRLKELGAPFAIKSANGSWVIVKAETEVGA